MAWKTTKLPLVPTRFDIDLMTGRSMPYARCPLHGDKIITQRGDVNVLVCDFCGNPYKYGSCSTCCRDTQRECQHCGKNTCPACGRACNVCPDCEYLEGPGWD